MKTTMERVMEIICIIAAIICVIYGVIVCVNGSGTGFYIVWLFLAGAFLVLAWLIHSGTWMRLPQALRCVVLVLVGIGLAAFVFVEGLIVSHMAKTTDADLDYVIVLGAQVREDGPSVVLRYRLDRTFEYLETHPDTICILSGGQGSNEPFSEAEGMVRYLEQKGIAKERLIPEAESLTTAQNIQNSKKLLPQGASVGIITNDFHMFRALQIAKKQGLPDAVGITAGSERSFLPHNMLREFFAEIKFLLLSVIHS